MCPGNHTTATTRAPAAMKRETPGPGAAPRRYRWSMVPRSARWAQARTGTGDAVEKAIAGAEDVRDAAELMGQGEPLLATDQSSCSAKPSNSRMAYRPLRLRRARRRRDAPLPQLLLDTGGRCLVPAVEGRWRRRLGRSAKGIVRKRTDSATG
jgi:hypothetical protein